MSEDAETPEEYFPSRGFDVQVEERDLHAEHMVGGEPGRASFFAPNRRYACIHFVREGRVMVRDYAHGETVTEALTRARQRYRSEQG